MKIWNVVKNCIVTVLVIVMLLSLSKIGHYAVREYIWEAICILHYDYNEDDIGFYIVVGSDSTVGYNVSLEYGNKVVELPEYPEYIGKYISGGFIQGLYYDRNCLVDTAGGQYGEYDIVIYEDEFTIRSNEAMETDIRYANDADKGLLPDEMHMDLCYQGDLTVITEEEHMVFITGTEFDDNAYPTPQIVISGEDNNGSEYFHTLSFGRLKEPVRAFEIRRAENGGVSIFFDMDDDGIYETEYKDNLVER